MEEKTYIGYSSGTFQDDHGVSREYCSVYMVEDFSGDESETRHYGGKKAAKYRCESPDVFAKIKLGSRVKCYFSSTGRLAFMQAVVDGSGKD